MKPWKIAVIVGVVLLALIVGAIGGLFILGGEETTSAEPESEPAPSAVNESQAGASALLEEMRAAGYSEAEVYIKDDGEVLLIIGPKADSTEMMREEFRQIAMRYSGVMADHPETHGLTIDIGGVQALVSSEAATAHANGDLQDDAYWETVIITGETVDEDEQS